MKKLVKGILEYRQNSLAAYREKFAHLALGQFPDALFIACSDSRVVPNLFASTNPGDLFVVRNVGNMIPPHEESLSESSAEAAAIDFSLGNLPIRNIIVCGHSECGAMQAVLAGKDRLASGALKKWLCHCSPADHRDLDLSACSSFSPHNKLALSNVLQQMDHLKTYPNIAEKVEKGLLKIHGWYFDIATGDVYAFEKALNRFIVIDEAEGEEILKRLQE